MKDVEYINLYSYKSSKRKVVIKIWWADGFWLVYGTECEKVATCHFSNTVLFILPVIHKVQSYFCTLYVEYVGKDLATYYIVLANSSSHLYLTFRGYFCSRMLLSVTNQT